MRIYKKNHKSIDFSTYIPLKTNSSQLRWKLAHIYVLKS